MPWGDLATELSEADLLVNASSLGMVGQPPLKVDVGALPGRAVVADAVYVPLRTPLIEAASARGLRVARDWACCSTRPRRPSRAGSARARS